MSSRRRALTTVALLAATAAAGHASTAAAAPSDATASARFGDAEVWLQPKEGDRLHRVLAYASSPGATPKVLDANFRARYPYSKYRGSSDAVALGRDTAGKLTAVVVGRSAISAMPVSGTSPLRAIPGTTKRDNSPSVFRGRLAFSRRISDVSSVHVGALTGGTFRRVAVDREPAHAFFSTAVAAGGGVAYVTYIEGEDIKYLADLAVPGRPAKRLVGPVGSALELLGATTDGTGVRLRTHGGESFTDATFGVPSGARR